MSETRYFPARAFAYGRMDGTMQERWFSTQLSDLREPPLFGRKPSDEAVYRFTLLPSFNHPITIRLDFHADGTAKVSTKVGKGFGGYAPKGMMSEETHNLALGDAEAFRVFLEDQHFWVIPTEPNAQAGTDGDEWLIEASEGRRYHVVDRWEGKGIREIGQYFLDKLGKFSVEARDQRDDHN